ncbi:MAG TPA: TIM barrel protein, partial [Bryobacteraceae bacterium]|nr:TIM barrel protein [Bryobacteraceae bacterium]
YDALDLTVRPKGHVLPERVTGDLPIAAEAIRKAGLELPMITSHIVDAKTPHAEDVLKAMVSVGVKRYRWGGFRYDLARSIPAQLAEFKPRVKDLAAMNKQYGVCAMYHTHSGPREVGASFWDLYMLLDGNDRNAVAANFDIGHATVEGGHGGWMHSANLLLPHARGVAFKDFRWVQDKTGNWVPGWCPMGDGMVNFRQFLPMLKASGFAGPLQLHMEYHELGAAAEGGTTSSVPRDKLLPMMRQDVVRFRALLSAAGLG